MAIALMVGGGSIVYFTRAFCIHSEQSRADAQARLVADAVIGPALRPVDFDEGHPNRADRLERLLRQRVLSDDVVGAGIYDSTGRAALIAGTVSTTRSAVRDALARGRLSGRIRTAADGAKQYETVVPLRFGRAGAAGAAVVAVDYGPLAAAARSSYIPISIALELAVAAMFVLLVPAVRRAIRETEEDLADAHAHAVRDGLTGLPNRRLFDDRLHQTIAAAQRSCGTAALLVLDLDRFKEINDTVGHAAGDRVLREVACRLVGALRETDTVARIGGDEFAVVVAESGTAALHETALRIEQALSEPVEHDGVGLAVGASIGIAVFPAHGATAEDLLRRADEAMYQAKRKGLGHVMYDAGTPSAASERRRLARDLAHAVARDEMLLHYQPVVPLDPTEAIGVEALLRWEHPRHGLLAADRFLRLVDDVRVRARLQEFAIETAIGQAERWRESGLAPAIAVNLDVRSLADRSLPARMQALCGQHGVPAGQIEIELAETPLLDTTDALRSATAVFAAAGIGIVVDEVGADRTSLQSLAALPVGKLKIDRSFLVRALAFERERIVLAGAVDVAHKLGLLVVVAGVESDEEFAVVVEVGADYAQGYHLGAPADAAAIERLLAAPAELVL